MSSVTSSKAPSDAAATTAAFDVVAAAGARYYASNCFHLSPTLNTWCPLRAADIEGLTCFVEYESQKIFFHLNHPIRFVRVTGVVVESRDTNWNSDRRIHHVYRLDDGSGATVRCLASNTEAAEAVRAALLPGRKRGPLDDPGTATPARHHQNKDAARIPIGTVLDVKGELHRFGGGLEVQVTKATPLRSTAQETQVWAKMHAFGRDTLARPWVLDRAVVRACGRAARQARQAQQAQQAQRQGQPGGASGAGGAGGPANGASPTSRQDWMPASARPRKPPPKKWRITPD